MFIDTNVFVPARFRTAPRHEMARAALIRAGLDSEPTRISRQVLREYLSTVTRRQDWSEPLPVAEALHDIEWLCSTFEILEDGERVTNMLVALFREFPVAGKQVHDANIAATMLAYGERRLLTFNTKDFRRFGKRIELVEIEAMRCRPV